MVNSISSSVSQYQVFARQDNSLTDEQKTTLEEIIANYDPENMTDADKKTMMEEIRAADIAPSKDVKEILDAAGFEPPEKPEGEMPPPSPQNGSKELPDFLTDFLQKQESSEVTEDDVTQLLQQLQQNGYDTSGLVIDQKS